MMGPGDYGAWARYDEETRLGRAYFEDAPETPCARCADGEASPGSELCRSCAEEIFEPEGEAGYA
jgi:hypothetical protein